MTLTFQPIEESMNLDGDTVLRFLSGIDKAIDEAGGGQFRAFKLLAELDKLGLEIKSKSTCAMAAQPSLAAADLVDLVG